MKHAISFIILLSVKLLSRFFYRIRIGWVGKGNKDSWKEDIKLILVLNHTSLYEPLFLSAIPFHFMWKYTSRISAPGASKTLDRPIIGRFWKMMMPQMTSISRKRDSTWVEFMDTVKEDAVVIIAPEGRMKRPNGLDVNGKKMTVRGGVADVIQKMNNGKILMVYSGGLHHVQAPGQTFPRLFKTIKVNFELINVQDFKTEFTDRKQMIESLQWRLENNCPQ